VHDIWSRSKICVLPLWYLDRNLSKTTLFNSVRRKFCRYHDLWILNRGDEGPISSREWTPSVIPLSRARHLQEKNHQYDQVRALDNAPEGPQSAMWLGWWPPDDLLYLWKWLQCRRIMLIYIEILIPLFDRSISHSSMHRQKSGTSHRYHPQYPMYSHCVKLSH